MRYFKPIIAFCYVLSISLTPIAAQSAVNTVPEKWKNESAVILKQELSYGYYNTKFFGSLTVIVNERIERSVKLQDKAAVTDFSEFYFYESAADERRREKGEKAGKDEAKVKISVIKPSGERIKVNIADAVEVTKDVPRFYRSFYIGDKTYKKIAIPNLNVGDILDYVLEVQFRTYLDNRYNTYTVFPAFYNTLAGKYPIVKQEFVFMLEKGFHINLNTYNGAPKFKLVPTGKDLKGKESDDLRSFKLVDSDRDKTPEETMSFPNTFYPSVKLQVVAQKSDVKGTEGKFFIGEPNVAKYTVTPDEVGQRFNTDYRNSYTGINDNEFNRFEKKNNLKNAPFEKKVRMAYSYVKLKFALQITISGFSADTKTAYFNKFEQGLYPIKDFYFATYMSKCLSEMDVKHEVIAVMPRTIGKIENLLLAEEITWIVKAEGGGKSIYLYPMNSFATSDVNREPYLYGSEGYSFTPTTDRRDAKTTTAKKVTIPIPDPSVNTLSTKTAAAFDDQMELLTSTRTTEATGVLKDRYIFYAILGHDYTSEYIEVYDPDYEPSKNQNKNAKKSKSQLKYDAEFDAAKKELADKQKELLASELKDDFEDIEKYEDFDLINPGVLDEKPVLKYSEKFQLKNLLSKAGRNYTLDVGKLLAKQPKLDDDDLKPRQSEVQMNFPKDIKHEVELTLPTGYTIEDLKDINFNIDNDMMSFKVESSVVGDKLIVKTHKIYKRITAPKADWQKVVDVFQKAYDFSQKKVVLKKKV